jgi:SET domain-containing protein
MHGYGVFATRAFAPGEIITYGDGVLYREAEEFDDEYALILPGYESDANGDEGPSLYYDLADQTRWINHSCTPNSEVETSWDPLTKTATAWWMAIAPVARGDEISYDYAFSAHLAIPCNCRTSGCRGVICDEDELHLVLDSMRPYVSAAYRERLGA